MSRFYHRTTQRIAQNWNDWQELKSLKEEYYQIGLQHAFDQLTLCVPHCHKCDDTSKCRVTSDNRDFGRRGGGLSDRKAIQEARGEWTRKVESEYTTLETGDSRAAVHARRMATAKITGAKSGYDKGIKDPKKTLRTFKRSLENGSDHDARWRGV